MELLRKDRILLAYIVSIKEFKKIRLNYCSKPALYGNYKIASIEKGIIKTFEGEYKLPEELNIPKSYGFGKWRFTKLNGYLIWCPIIKILKDGKPHNIEIKNPADLLVSFSGLTKQKVAKITLEDILNLTIDDIIFRLQGILIEETT